MSTVKANSHQVGQSVTATNNFTLYQPATPDGTVRLGVGNAGSTTTDVITASSTGVTIPSVSSNNTFGFKNRIINGGMVIDQRNAGASVTASTSTSGSYITDRFREVVTAGTGVFTVQKNTSAPVGFINSLKATVTTAYSVTGTDRYEISQLIEGNNIADLAWGTANAKTVTLSFWVRSSLTGTFGGVIQNANADYNYPFTYTISSADTWTQVSITVTGATSGTWATDNTQGLKVTWSLGCGSTRLGTAGSWSSTRYEGATGQTQVIGTNGATFYLTGVQLEVGSQATSFDFRSYGQELALCQRYFEKSFAANVAPYTNGGDASGPIVLNGTPTASNTYTGQVLYSVEKRTNPTITLYNPGAAANNVSWYNSAGAITNGGGVNASAGARGFCLVLTGDTTRTVIAAHYTASAEM